MNQRLHSHSYHGKYYKFIFNKSGFYSHCREALQCRNGAQGILHLYQLSFLFKEREDFKSYLNSRKAIHLLLRTLDLLCYRSSCWKKNGQSHLHLKWLPLVCCWRFQHNQTSHRNSSEFRSWFLCNELDYHSFTGHFHSWFNKKLANTIFRKFSESC